MTHDTLDANHQRHLDQISGRFRLDELVGLRLKCLRFYHSFSVHVSIKLFEQNNIRGGENNGKKTITGPSIDSCEPSQWQTIVEIVRIRGFVYRVRRKIEALDNAYDIECDTDESNNNVHQLVVGTFGGETQRVFANRQINENRSDDFVEHDRIGQNADEKVVCAYKHQLGVAFQTTKSQVDNHVDEAKNCVEYRFGYEIFEDVKWMSELLLVEKYNGRDQAKDEVDRIYRENSVVFGVDEYNVVV